MSKPSDELLRRARKQLNARLTTPPNANDELVNSVVGDMAEFAEQIVRECAEAASAHKRKDYDHRCSLEFRYGYECAAENAGVDILRKFGLKE